jgi:hypothetical protein
MAPTPIENFTKNYMEALEELALSSDQEIKEAYKTAAKALALLYLSLPSSKAQSFRLTKASDVIFKELRENLSAIFEKRIQQAMALSKTKNTLIFNRKIKIDPILEYLNRKISDKTLKQRLLKYSDMFKMEIEGRLAIGISNKETQSAFIRSLNKFIDDPYSNLIVAKKTDWAARRIAVKYNTQKGVYKSSFANMKRLIRGEAYEAFRKVDHIIWKSAPEVTGVLVYLNPAHPQYDSCDELVGLYPKGFFFSGFHPSCICLAKPIIKGTNITSVPKGAKDYMNQDGPKKWWGELPFITENKKYWK